MSNYKEHLAEQLKDEEFKKEYDSLEIEYNIICALIKARNELGLTQKQLSKATGISQGDISRLEKGKGNPSLKTLRRLADGLGMTLNISFSPVNS